jgi:hypothetical protein
MVQTLEKTHYNESLVRRMAWWIVIGSFFVLCTLSLTVTLGVYIFFFESTTSLDTVVRVGRGTAVITDADVADRALRTNDLLVGRPALVNTDLQSQAEITFEDVNNATVATLILQPNTAIEVNATWQPRFEWSNGRYDIEISDVRGLVDITIPKNETRSLLLQIRTAQGALIHITGQGRYVLDVTDNRIRFVNRSGSPAVLFGRDPSQNVVVDAGKSGLVYASRVEPVVANITENLLANSFFFSALPELPRSNDSGAIPVPERWGCTNVQDQLPRGTILEDDWSGRASLRLLRSDGADSNGQTRCKHPFADGGISVQAYNYLELDMTFLINYQSLSECGVEGSECPLMLHLEYIDINGIAREWYKGFYAYIDAQFDYFKPRCSSCFEDHQRINEKTWYTYRTGNLFSIFAEDIHPAYITNVEFYASGHQYDTFVSDISMMAGIVDAVLPPVDVSQNDGLDDQ